MKDFDIVRAERLNSDRTFRIAGKEFTFFPAIPASAQADYEDSVGASTSAASLDAMDNYVLSALPDGQHEAWREARAQTGEMALSVSDIIEVIRHITEVTTGRPTVPSGGSTGQASKPGTKSKAASSSQEEEA